MAIQQGLPPAPVYVETLRYLARIRSKLGEYETAVTHLTEAETICRSLMDLGEYAAVVYEHMVVCKHLNQLDEAIRYGNECLETFQQLGSLRWQALVKTQLAVLHQAQNEAEKALTLFHDGLQIFIELDDLFEQAYSHYYLYRLYATLDDEANSLKAKQQAYQLAVGQGLVRLQQRLEQAP